MGAVINSEITRKNKNVKKKVVLNRLHERHMPQLGRSSMGDDECLLLCKSVDDFQGTASTDLGITNKF